MRDRKRRALRREVLAMLEERHLEVVCGDCAASYIAKWVDVEFLSVKKYVARSEVECTCGASLHTFMVPEDLLYKSGSEPILHAC
jgi:hypothetical protein